MALIAESVGENAKVVVVAGNGLDRRGPVDALMAEFCRALDYAPAPGGLRRPADVLARRAPRRARALAAAVLATPGINRVARQKFSSACDWSRTRAFAIPDPFVGLIRVNLEGREPAGVVAPGAEYEQTVAELEEDLRALRDPRTGDPVIERVARTRATDGGPPPRCPDVMATFRGHEPPLLAIEHPRATIRQAEPWWQARNGHACRAMIIGAGSPESIACLEVAPMIRALVG
jgi:predicted AlkP superfamily phosphohydrolase/phosphomutase